MLFSLFCKLNIVFRIPKSTLGQNKKILDFLKILDWPNSLSRKTLSSSISKLK